jgi:GNAT superfamily N-acetyltransferase
MEIVTLTQRPELIHAHWDLTSSWPEFMLEDPIADLYYSQLDVWSDFALLALDGEEIIARGFSVGFALGDEIGRRDLAADGWDGVVRWSWLDRIAGRAPTHVSALEVTVSGDRRRTGVATEMVRAMIRNTDRLGFRQMAAPVRPIDKQHEPGTSMSEYAGRIRSDGLPADGWMRIHARLGAETHAVCPNSMVISGSLDQWRTWTGLPFDESGEVTVPGALVPVHVDVAQNHAVYVEPNVWMVHRW